MPCYIERTSDGGKMFICGDLGPHCRDCSAVGDYLCDYPVGEGKTCDAPMCETHASEVAPNTHYCAGHMALWAAYRESGAVERELENVVPYKRSKLGGD
jgi:hypothetical protein